MSRIPIRLRLTLVFVLSMAAMLGGLGFVLFHHLESSLDRTLDQALRARAADVTALAQQADTGLHDAPAPPLGATASFAQVLTVGGRIVDETRGLGAKALVDGATLALARRAPALVPRARLHGVDVRLLAVAARAQGRGRVVVVGGPLAARDEALANLREELLLAGPAALVVVSLIGYLFAAAALSPVERMRARARSISERHLSDRLPVPAARDEIRRLGDTLNDLLARIEQSVARERTFVADASHELRSPLALLQTEVELALEEGRDERDFRSALRSIGAETDRLSQLADDLLLLAQLDGGRLPLRLERLAARTVLQDAALRFGRRAAEARRAFEIDAPDLAFVADRLRIEQALGNLVENALRHGAGTVHLRARPAGEGVELSVADEGGGFPDGFAASAFERFTRAHVVRGSGGAGLGLSIVKAIVEAHGGSVSLAGATVVLRLPGRREDRAAETHQASSGSAGTTARLVSFRP